MVWVYPVINGPDINIQVATFNTSSTDQLKCPDEAAPQTTPQIKGIQVIGFINWRRIFQIDVSPDDAPFIPNSCRVLAPRSEFASVVDASEG